VAGHATGDRSPKTPYDPLAATPVVPPGVEAVVDRALCVQIRRPLRPQKGFGGWVNRKMGFHRDVRVNLDEHGTAYWQQIDGSRTLADIERELRRRFNLGADECRAAVVKFTKMLMLRGLVALRMPEGHPVWQEVNRHG
jgi:hypothetical protein